MKRIVRSCVKLRREKGISQRYLAAMIGCSQPLICLMETGKSNPAMLVKYWSKRGLQAA